MRGLLASPLALLIGLSLGTLGGGGSILAIPALVYGAGQDARAATATSLLIVGLSAGMSLADHARRGNVRWSRGVVFGAAGIGGNALGTALNRKVDPDVLLLVFSFVMVGSGVAMLRRMRKARSGEAAPAAGPQPLDARVVAKVMVAGSIVGMMTGFFGVGGGFVIVPALVLSLGFAMPEAVGTSLLVIAINAGTALALRAGTLSIDWTVAAPFVVAAAIGAVLGSRFGSRLDPVRLTKGFVVLLFSVATYTAVSSGLALA